MASRGAKEEMTLPGASLMTDGYLGGISLVTNHQVHSSIFGGSQKLAFSENNQSDPEETAVKCALQSQRATSSHMNEYNGLYHGLMIIPWDDFAKDPRQLNDLFNLEKTGFITFDSDEVNVFFHATRMNKPVLGEISENGKSWVITVETVRDLEKIRVSLLEKTSVFGLTLVKKEKRFGKSSRAPCLLTLDPHRGCVGEQIDNQIMKCISIMEERKNFCLQITFNGSVERWCRRVTTTVCRSVGARLIITNGEEADSIDTAENIVCCVVCFPIWAIQTGVYKAHRAATYQDLELNFGAEEVLLYGSFGTIQNQRLKLFRDPGEGDVFYTSPSVCPPTDQSHKYICVKKYDKHSEDPNITSKVEQHQTTNVRNLFADKQEKLMKGYNLQKGESGKNSKEKKHKFELRASDKQGTQYSYNNKIETKETRAISPHSGPTPDIASKDRRTYKPEVNNEASPRVNSQTANDELEENETTVVELEKPKVSSAVVLQDNLTEKDRRGATKQRYQSSQGAKGGIRNPGFESDDDIDSESHIDVPKSTSTHKMLLGETPLKTVAAETEQASSVSKNNIGASNAVKESGQTNGILESSSVPSNKLPPIARGKLPPLNVKNVKQQVDGENSLFETNMKFKHRRQLSQGLVEKSDIDNIIAEAEKNIIAVSKTPQTYEVDTTDVDKTDVETDLDLSDLESDDDTDDKSDVSPFARVNESKSAGTGHPTTALSAKRRKPAYDSRRRYLAVQFPKKHPTCSKPDTQGNNMLSTM